MHSRKDETAHVVLAWREEKILAILSFYPIEEKDVSSYKEFFKTEVDIHNEMFQEGSKLTIETPNANEATPKRTHVMTEEASRNAATPHKWGDKRHKVQVL